MRLSILTTTIAVTAKEHNPTILHPTFLVSEKIVEDGWELAQPPICTPPVSIVKYQNGLAFIVESSKFQLTDGNPPAEPKLSHSPDIAIRYIQTLPHVHYTAVGINLDGILEYPNPEAMTIEKFLKIGTWNDSNLKPASLSLRITYPVEDGILHLTVESGRLQNTQDGRQKMGVVLRANYHTELPKDNPLPIAQSAISKFGSRWDHFEKTVRTIFDLEN